MIFDNSTVPHRHENLSDAVKSYIESEFPDYTGIVFTDSQKSTLRKYNQFFYDLELVEKNHEQYNLNRALSKTQEVLGALSDEMHSKRLNPQSNILEKRLQDNEQYCNLHVLDDVKLAFNNPIQHSNR